ncbi:hypothetical protein P153DRAFT_376886 [Dothidotthia symphoricarpi CBS 119687]|uniref:Dolichyl-diphosphooligosaccharide-protein glycosyltransferase subunit OST5 n=1 Tax=Dothidotthia symphoricarpi CBS 119687 TaxID=1392245 RepID=A0A6A6A9W2_9PLEO|nr:uncharacterized protein P153DRAFT_376886 [Dothidotthia symphoricarpi CBS 119687]KAF2127965.1 hypothetical protein P153DRAFT_376886 [Dothidotthia symphoricarpi CBS 119687]
MSSPLLDVWEAAAASPYQPSVGKDTQFTVGAVLLLLAFFLTGVFGLNRSVVNLPLLGAPASLAFGFGAVYMICAVGVYV